MPLPASVVQRQVSTQTVLLLLSLLHLGVLMMMVMVVMGMIWMQRGWLSLHQCLAMKAERAKSLAGQIHGRCTWMVFGSGGGCCGVVQAHLRLGQVSGQVMMVVMWVMRMMTWWSDAHKSGRGRSWTRCAIVVATTNGRRWRLSPECRTARIVSTAGRWSSDRSTTVVTAADQSRSIFSLAVFIDQGRHWYSLRRILDCSLMMEN